MARIRKRLALPLYNQLCKFSPLVGVFGHRQVGKTTFVSSHVEKYVTFDDESSLQEANKSAKDFLSSHASSRTVIDECQYSPKLFPALKEWVRTRKKPGQFVLTGSVRFSSRKAIRESLTGRLVSLELFPLVTSEILQTELPETIPKIIKAKVFDDNILALLSKPLKVQQDAFVKYFNNGGLPGLCFIREPRLQHEGISALINLILDRDLRMIVRTTLSLETLKRFLQFIAKNAWLPYRYADVQRQVGLSEVTQKKLLFGFESIYLIRRFTYLGTKGEIILLEDQLEESFLSETILDPHTKMLGALVRNIRAQFGYRMGEPIQINSYRTRGGARVPLVFQSHANPLGMIVVAGDRPELSQSRSADSFLRRFQNAKIVYVCQEPIEPKLMDSRSLIASAASLVT